MKKTDTLKKGDIKKLSKILKNWTLNTKETELSQTFTFESHLDALIFIARLSVYAQVLSHYPEVLFSEKKVKVKITTLTCKALTTKDIELAMRIDTLHAGIIH